MTLSHDIEITGSDEFATALAMQLVKKGHKKPAQDVFARALRRSLAKTGSETTKKLKQFFRDGKNNFAPQSKHPLTGLVVQSMAAKNRPSMFTGKKTDLEFATKRRTVPGGKLGRMMEYQLDEKDGQWVKIGLIPEKRGFGWDKKFANWQEAGRLDFSGYNNGNNFFAMMRYTSAIGVPLTRWPVRPARPVISKIDDMYNPSAMFEQFFLERLGG
jgi:hypothetical protein